MYSRSQSGARVRGSRLFKHNKPVGPCTARQGSLGSWEICNIGEFNQVKFKLASCRSSRSRASEIMTSRGDHRGPELSF